MSAKDFDVALSAPGYERKWERVRAGDYRSEDNKWRIEEEGQGKWFVSHRLDEDYWEEWGQWETTIYGNECQPFETLFEAMASVEEAEYREFD